MKQRLSRFFQAPWYPLMFSIFPALALLGNNADQVRWSIGARPALIALIVALVLFGLLRLILRQWHRAAFALTLLLVIFFSYGHIYSLLLKKDISNLGIWMPAAALVLTLLVFIWATRKSLTFTGSALALNIISLGLVAYSVGQIVYLSIPTSKASVPPEDHLPPQEVHIPPDQPLPDIYYIILDSYARADRLQTLYNYDNSDFVNHLEEMGFYVADCSQSNYGRTDLALTSTFNMDYIQHISDKFTPRSISRTLLFRELKHSAVRQILEENGYKTVAFATGFTWDEISDADVYIAPSPFSPNLTEFEAMFLDTTPFRHLTDLGLVNLDRLSGQRFRERTLLVLDSLNELPKMPGPKFVFVHLIDPHPPFVFGPNGEEIDSTQFLDKNKRYNKAAYTEGYLYELEYISKQMEQVLSKLISESATPPVIVMQGDHGPWLQEKARAFDILNAYYLPGHSQDLYPTISPVNTFRIILNEYLGTAYPLLEDESYASPVPKIYNFTFYPNPCIEK